MKTAAVCLLLTVYSLVTAGPARNPHSYKGYQVFSVTPKTRSQVGALRRASNILGEDVSLWQSEVLLNRNAMIHASSSLSDKLVKYLRLHGMKERLVIADLDVAIRNQVANRQPINGTRAQFPLDEYHPLEEIETWLFELAIEHSGVATVVTIGKSYDEHNLYALKVSTDPAANKPVIWLDGGIHASEWIGPAILIYFIDEFMKNYATDELLVRSLESYDWYFLPVYNVDGYRYSWAVDGDRLWRKTRTPNPGSTCIGTDPNRNWDIAWGTVGISHDPCNFAFCGQYAFSEPSVRAVADFIGNNITTIAYFAYHSYAQFFMLPYGYTIDQAPDFPELMEVCQRGAIGTYGVHGKFYECNSLVNLVDLNSGSSIDYTYGVLGIKYSFGIELRDKGEFGFLLPPDQIIPTAEENVPFVREVVQHILDNEN